MRKKLEREGGTKIRKNFGPVAGQVNEGDQFFKQLMRAMKKKQIQKHSWRNVYSKIVVFLMHALCRKNMFFVISGI